MAELQWTVQVRCVNALLAEIKVGEKGELIIVDVPDRNFGPSEFDKFIQGLEVAAGIAAENRKCQERAQRSRTYAQSCSKPRGKISVQRKRDLYELRPLNTGEIVNVIVPDMLFVPSELNRFVKELRSVRGKMEKSRTKLRR